jgi:ABC-type transporter Mla subunit MlaD
MSAGQLAALIAAGFFGLLAIAGIYVLLRLGKLIGVTTQMATSYRDRADTLLDQAQAVVDRTNEQLARTDSITASMDQVTANMAELSGNVSVLAGFARGLAGAVSAPVTGLAALSYGVRHAVTLRRPDAVPPLPAAPSALHQPEPAASRPARLPSSRLPAGAAPPAEPGRLPVGSARRGGTGR